MQEFLQFSKEIPEGTVKEDEIYTIAGQHLYRMMADRCASVGIGRVFSIRASGQKLRFYDVHSESQRLQVIANARLFEGSNEAFAELHNTVRRGDIIGVEGYPGYSNTGEFSMFAKKFVVLSPCLHMPPSVRYGLTEKVKHVMMVDLSVDAWHLGNAISTTISGLDVQHACTRHLRDASQSDHIHPEVPRQ